MTDRLKFIPVSQPLPAKNGKTSIMHQKICIPLITFIGSVSGYCQQSPQVQHTLWADAGADSILKLLTLEEKVTLMQDVSASVDRLGIKKFEWWNEALHGVARAGLATVFPQPIGMAATFSDETVYQVFDAVSDEARAKYNQHRLNSDSPMRYEGLTMWTPTINIFRDPRWGRGIETYGEDPYLTSRMGLASVTGLQGPLTGKYRKVAACAKHFAVHSGPEWNRHSFDISNLSDRDLYETYLPAFQTLVMEGAVDQVMCAYNRFENSPCCGNNRLLQHILREQWGFRGIVVADCGAIADFYRAGGHQVFSDAEAASGAAVSAGTDLDCGSSYRALVASVAHGQVDESKIDSSVKRLLKERFLLGELGSPTEVPWDKIPYSVVGSRAHDSLSLEAARKSMTLLTNNGILPLKTGGLKVAVMGPNANDSTMQWGNYNGTPPSTVTILDGLRKSMGPTDSITFEQGCSLIERTVFKSAFGQCSWKGKKGFAANYWNNATRAGSPDRELWMSNAFSLSAAGNTVFAPGIDLTGFSAQYQTTLKAERTGKLVFEMYMNGAVRLLVDGKECANVAANHGSRKVGFEMPVVAGHVYDIELQFNQRFGDAQLNFDLGYKKPVNFQASLERIRDFDIVVFVGGISPFVEGEEMGVDLPGFRNGDRTDIELPSIQREFLRALHEAGKKVILVNCSGSAIGLEPELSTCDAILQAWYPGQQGGTAVADVLMGRYNPAGRLPVTFYKNAGQLPDFENYQMPGRTYRFFKDKPLFPFGYGLSYSSFSYTVPKIKKARLSTSDSLAMSVAVTNRSGINGEEVIQVYIRKKDDESGPVKTLRAFKRVSLPANETVQVEFVLSGRQLDWWDGESLEMSRCPGQYELLVGPNSDEDHLQAVPFSIR